MATTPDLPRNILLHTEPCFVHGVALVKNRAQGASDFLSGASTFSARTRNWRFNQALRDDMLALVQSHLVVTREACPPEISAASRNLVEKLYGPLDSDYLWKARKRSRVRKPSGVLQDLESILAVVNLGQGGLCDMRHYCCVAPGSADAAAGKLVGQPCCASRDEAVEKVATPLINCLLHRPWSQQCESRWTMAMTTLRRVAIGTFAFGLLPAALRSLKVHWDLSGDGVEAVLARIIEADSDNFTAKSKLRLLRVVQKLCNDEVPSKLATVIETLKICDALLYAGLGHEQSKRASLRDLVSESGSLFSKAQRAVVGVRLLVDVVEWLAAAATSSCPRFLR